MKQRISIKFDIWVFFESLSRKFNFQSNLTRITSTLLEGQNTFLMIYRSFFLGWEVFQTRDVEKIETHNNFFRKSCHLWDNVENIVDPDRLPLTIWRMGTACCIIKATNTHSEYVIPIAFPLQQWLHERVSMLRYTCCTLPVFLQPRWIVIIYSGSLVIEGPNPTTTLQLFLHLVTVQNRHISTTNTWRHTPQSPLWIHQQ